MSKVPKWKAIVIVATILICLYGIIGLPKSKQELAANWEHNIRLGLDLRGGTLLVLQVQLQDAFKADAVTSIERLKELMSKNSIAGEPMLGYEPKTLQDAEKVEILIKGVPADSSKNFRSIVSEEFTAWVLTPVGPSDYRMTMKPTEAGNLRKETLARSISTIENRINGMGLSESTVQERQGSGADAEVLVSLPGMDDPDRVKNILKTAALLELYEVKSGPFKSEVKLCLRSTASSRWAPS